MSTFAQRHHAQQTSRQAVTTPTTEAAMLHQHFMSAAAAAAAAMASTSVASVTQGPTMGSMPTMAGPLVRESIVKNIYNGLWSNEKHISV